MKKINLFLIVILFCETTYAGGILGGRNSVFRKPFGRRGVRISRPRIVVPRVPSPVAIVENTLNAAADVVSDVVTVGTTGIDNVAQTTTTAATDISRETGRGLENIRHESNRTIHQTGRLLGDTVLELRNWLAQLQGVNVRVILSRIRGYIDNCRQNTSELRAITLEMRALNEDIAFARSSNPNMTNAELAIIVQRKIDGLEKLKVGVGTAAGVGQMTFKILGHYFINNSALAAGATTFYIAAATMIAAMHFAQEEIKHELRKLTAASDEYAVVSREFNAEKERYDVMMINNDSLETEFEDIITKYSNFISQFYVCRNIGSDCEIVSELRSLKAELLQSILVLLPSVNEEKRDVLREYELDLNRIGEL